MILYLSIIGIAWVIISVLNIVLGSYTFDHYALWIILATFVSIIFQIAIDGTFAIVVHSLPDKWFGTDKKFFNVSRNERKFYDRLKIKSWKDKVWELGALGGFRKNKIAEPDSSDYFLKFIYESNKGVVMHIIGIFVGFLVIFILPFKYALRIGFPVACVNLLLNIMPTMILRYNIPKLQVGYERAKRLESRQKNKVEDSQEDLELAEATK